ncbi:SLATT domain-containing protein [Streptomyces violens]|uniref:SLATT domain-containing protein n=1 Tax=Streptomyces violens TaxID=66377 RepID=UPI0012FE87C4|nr:SLATT domain-containing protein [Streptomyces violens]
MGDVLHHLAYEGQRLSEADILTPLPEGFVLTWEGVDAILSAAWKTDREELKWTIHVRIARQVRYASDGAYVFHHEYGSPDRYKPHVLLKNLFTAGSGSTWGDLVEEVIEYLNDPKQEYGWRLEPTKQYEYANSVITYRRDVATAERRVRRALLSRWLRLVPLVVMPLVLTVVAWGNLWPDNVPDLRTFNSVAFAVMLVLVVVFLVGFFLRVKDEEHGVRSVFLLRRDLEIIHDRWILNASKTRPTTERRDGYREHIPRVIDRLRRDTRFYRRIHNWFQWGVFFASVGTTATTAFWETPQPGKTILIALGSFLAFATAVTGYFKFRERAYNLQQTADQVEQHATAFDLGIAPYADADAAVNLERFAENVETLRMEQRKREQQLEQPHQGQAEVI